MRVLRVSRVVADLARAEAFYGERLGFDRVAGGSVDPVLARLVGVPGGRAASVVMRLGAEEIELVQCARPGPPYPRTSRSNDLWFQHLAIVVGDMEAAYRSLSAETLTAISTAGPQTLPASNGGVSAFKFRDPDFHPLELIHFPAGQGRPVWRQRARHARHPFLGLDHTALAISSTRRSAQLYQRLGFRVAGRSVNEGAPQSRLDDIAQAHVRVTSLRPDPPTGHEASDMGLELLAYDPPGRKRPRGPANARITDWTTLLVPTLAGGTRLADGTRVMVRRDPDGHILVLADRA